MYFIFLINKNKNLLLVIEVYVDSDKSMGVDSCW